MPHSPAAPSTFRRCRALPAIFRLRFLLPVGLTVGLTVALAVALTVALTPGPLSAQDARLLADLETGVSAASSLPFPAHFDNRYPPATTDPDGGFYFFADDGVHGMELWRADGTPGGERLVADICPGPCSSTGVVDAANVRRTDFPGRPLVLVADDGASGAQVWRIDEASGGAERLTNLCRDPASLCEANIALSDARLDDGRLLFTVQASDPAARGAWATDGTPAGTTRLWSPSEIGALNFGTLYPLGEQIIFPAYSNELGSEWYRTDGSGSLPQLIRDVCPGPCPRATGRARQVGDRLIYFWLDEDAREWQTWSTAGTAESTVSLEGACGDECPTGTNDLTVVNERGYFFTETHVWSTDGTVPGTRPLAALPQSVGTLSNQGAALGDAVVFLLGSSRLRNLWRLDDPTGPSPSWSILGTVSQGPAELASVGDRLLVAGEGIVGEDVVWTSDGTPNGTLPLDLPSLEYARSLRRVGDRFFFAGRDERGLELWTSDGTTAGTGRLVDLLGDPAGSDPGDFQRLGEGVVFVSGVDGGGAERDLWTTDGTEAGTERVFDASIHLGDFAAGLRDLVSLGDRALFQLDADGTGHEPWITDGTAEGTVFLGDLQPGDDSSHARDPVRLGGSLLFAADQGQGEKLWTTDGTPGGTRILLDIDPDWVNDFYGCRVCSPPGPPGPIFPRDLTRLGEHVVFAAVTGEYGAEPWITDGTAEGTRLLADLVPGPGWSEPTNFVRAGDLVYFLATDAGQERVELWRTDGTESGTLRISTLSGPSWLVNLHQEDPRFRLAGFFDGSDRVAVSYVPENHVAENHVVENEPPRLWIAGPAPGQRRDVVLLDPIREMVTQGSWLYLALARGDDAVPGTVLAGVGGPAGSPPNSVIFGPPGGGVRQLTATGAGVFFAATGEGAGHELWRLATQPDGRPQGLPELVADLRQGTAGSGPLPASSSPDELAVIPAEDGTETLYFSADDGAHGREPWTLDVASVPDDEIVCEPDEVTACVGDRFRLQAFFRRAPGAPEEQARTAAVGGGTNGGTNGSPNGESAGDTVFFTFFGDKNLELAVKILDGTPINDARWLFYGALSDVAYRIVAEDLQFSRSRTYENPAGEFCGRGDVDAFPNPQPPTPRPGLGFEPSMGLDPSHGTTASTPSPKSLCTDDPAVLCLHDRFEVRVDWRTEQNGEVETGQGTAIPYSSESGVFWFFGEGNTELVVKLLDGRPINDRWWFFYGALSDVAYEIHVLDRQTGDEATYVNEPGNLCGGADVEAFGG